MTAAENFLDLLRADAPVLALAPMQDVTTLQFMRVIARHGGPDVYWTEYFRVHENSVPDKWILKSITENPTGKPVVAQMIGNDIPALVRTAKLLQKYPVAAIDLNLGCPAPIVYRKCAGGGLLREPQRIDAILGALRDDGPAGGIFGDGIQNPFFRPGIAVNAEVFRPINIRPSVTGDDAHEFQRGHILHWCQREHRRGSGQQRRKRFHWRDAWLDHASAGSRSVSV